MIEVEYTASFVRQFKKFDHAFQDEILEHIELFKSKKNHQSLEVHLLHGALAGLYSFSINYRTRVIFKYARAKKSAQLLAVGGHEIYD